MRDDDLIAFLAARLDEDEERTDELHNRLDCDLGQLELYGKCSCGHPARALREVVFKRAILAEHRTAAGWSSDNWPLSLRLLAAVWSDHPDYRAGWAVAK